MAAIREQYSTNPEINREAGCEQNSTNRETKKAAVMSNGILI